MKFEKAVSCQSGQTEGENKAKPKKKSKVSVSGGKEDRRKKRRKKAVVAVRCGLIGLRHVQANAGEKERE